MNFGKMNRKFRKDVRAISPVIATLLMIAIAVVASLVAYAWVMGYMGFTTDKTGKAIAIQSVDGPSKTIYVQNVGNGIVTLKDMCVYVDGLGYATTQAATGVDLPVGNTIGLTLTAGTTPFVAGSHTYTIKVTSTDGTFSQINKNFPLP
jgi:archaeal type IV pilus assembly protein PilA